MASSQAYDLLSLPYIGQRPIIGRHAGLFAQLHFNGAWRTTSVVTLVVARQSGKRFLINGAHRLTFISRMPNPVGITIREIIVDDAYFLEEAEREYRIHDTNSKNRSSKDLLWSHDTVRSLGLDPHVADKVAIAAHFIELGVPMTSSGVDAKNRSADMRVPSLIKHVRAGERYLDYISSAPKTGKLYKALMTKGPMAAGLAICSNNLWEDDARRFFFSVSRDDGLSATDPRKLLVNLIVNGFAKSDGKKYSDAARAIYVRRAFDAFVNGDSPAHFRISAENEARAHAIVTA